MRLRAADLGGGWGVAALLVAVAAGIPGSQFPWRAQAMVGGAPPAPREFGRSVVMILGSSGTACTATAIGRDLLLTAAHCVQPGADYKLLGSEPGQPPVLKAIVRIERHPQFDIKRLLNHLATADVALIKLAEPLPARVSPASHCWRQRNRCRRRFACGRRLWRDRARRRPHRRHCACCHACGYRPARPAADQII
jgi:Trypsin